MSSAGCKNNNAKNADNKTKKRGHKGIKIKQHKKDELNM
jgi:hypothetical protein